MLQQNSKIIHMNIINKEEELDPTSKYKRIFYPIACTVLVTIIIVLIILAFNST
jgi:hypothetical protein